MKEPFFEPIFRSLRFGKVIRHIKPNSTVVDIGCGHNPRLLNRLEKYIKNGIGIDQLGTNTNLGKIKLMSYLLSRKIPLKDKLADHVTLVAVLEHLENPNEILSECYRILKKGGTIILTTPTPISKPILEFLSFKLGLVSQREIAEHKRYYFGPELTKAVKKSGFKKVQHYYFELWMNNFLIAEK